MCVDPLTATALLATTAGTVMQSREQNANMKRAVNARNDAHEAEQIRQRQFLDEYAGQFESAVNRFAPCDQQRQLGEVREQRPEEIGRESASKRLWQYVEYSGVDATYQTKQTN